MQKFWQGCIQLCLPNLCQLCHRSSPELVCTACYTDWLKPTQMRCLRCAHKLENSNIATHPTHSALICGTCLNKPPIFERTYTLGGYATPQDQLIWALKFNKQIPLANFFAKHLAQLIQQSLLETMCQPILLLPIPLSKERMQQRGYNQAWEITRRISRLCRLPADPTGLIKIRNTDVQTALDINARQRNLRGSFVAQASVKGQHILLIDDVMTSGITLNEAARTLRRAGALSIRNYVVMRTPRN